MRKFNISIDNEECVAISPVHGGWIVYLSDDSTITIPQILIDRLNAIRQIESVGMTVQKVETIE